MAGNFHPAPAPITGGWSLDAITLLQANGKLLAAADLDAVVRAARELLGSLVPGAEIRRCGRGVGTPVTAGAFGQQLQISLSKREILIVTAPDNHAGVALLKPAANLIEARVKALGKQMALAESVEHLGRSERLQRALYAIANQASLAGDDLTTMSQALHSIVSSLMYAENFYIAL